MSDPVLQDIPCAFKWCQHGGMLLVGQLTITVIVDEETFFMHSRCARLYYQQHLSRRRHHWN